MNSFAISSSSSRERLPRSWTLNPPALPDIDSDGLNTRIVRPGTFASAARASLIRVMTLLFRSVRFESVPNSIAALDLGGSKPPDDPAAEKMPTTSG